MQLDKQINEMKTVNLKNLQIQQANFINARNKRDLQILQERRDHNKRNFKMSLHIALLRQQLIQNGIDPVEINSAIKEFEQNVKADNSIKNVSGQALWLDDNNRMYPSFSLSDFSLSILTNFLALKLYFPDPHDYDKKKLDNTPK